MTDARSMPEPRTQPGSLSAAVEEALPRIAAQAEEAERLRRLPDATMALLVELGVIRSLVPSAYGGSEVDYIEFLHAVRRISSACVASGWLSGVLATHSHGISYYDKQAQDDVWGQTGPDAVVSSSFAPVVAGERVDGGVRLSGTWSFSSGVDHAAWTELGYRLESDSGETEAYLCLVPRADLEIVDNWNTVGLRGTGSKQVRLDGVFVPEHRSWGPGFMAPARVPGLHPHWLFRIPFIETVTAFSAAVLGAADGAMEAYTAQLKKRIRPHTGQPRLDNPVSYVRLAEADLELRAATALVEGRWARVVELARRGELETEDNALRRLSDDAYAARLAVSAVDRLVAAAGGSATMLDRPLQRYWRDIHAAAGHVAFDLENKLVILGRHLVGLPRDPTLL